MALQIKLSVLRIFSRDFMRLLELIMLMMGLGCLNVLMSFFDPKSFFDIIYDFL